MATLTGLAARVLAIGLVAVGLPALASAAPAHAATAVTVQPASPIPGERFTVTGKLTSKVVRPVRLEHRRCIRVGHHTKCTWTKVVEARTSPTGRFALTATAGKSSVKVRVVAKAVTIRGHHYRRVVSATKLLRPAAQRVSMSIPTTLLAGQSAVARLTLAPARRGRLTQVQALIGGR